MEFSKNNENYTFLNNSDWRYHVSQEVRFENCFEDKICFKEIEDVQKNLEFLTLVKSLNEKESIDKDTDKNYTDVKEV